MRNDEAGTLEALEAVLQHWPVHLFKNIQSNLNGQVWTDPEDVLIERRVMQLAERQAIGYDWFP
jgi:hypothetical protein